jgi:hypothetical protein
MSEVFSPPHSGGGIICGDICGDVSDFSMPERLSPPCSYLFSDTSASTFFIFPDTESGALGLLTVEGGLLVSGFTPASPPIIDEEEDVLPFMVEDGLICFFISPVTLG